MAHGDEPSPLTMFGVSQKFNTVLTDRDSAEVLRERIHAAAQEARRAIEDSNTANFSSNSPEARAHLRSTAIVSTCVDAMVREINAFFLHVHELTKNASDFYTLCIEVELSHRKLGHPLRPRGTPVNVDVRQGAIGPETIIDDDFKPSAETLQLSLF